MYGCVVGGHPWRRECDAGHRRHTYRRSVLLGLWVAAATRLHAGKPAQWPRTTRPMCPAAIRPACLWWGRCLCNAQHVPRGDLCQGLPMCYGMYGCGALSLWGESWEGVQGWVAVNGGGSGCQNIVWAPLVLPASLRDSSSSISPHLAAAMYTAVRHYYPSARPVWQSNGSTAVQRW